MDFTNFDQMNQMISMASGMLSQTLLWVMGGLVLGLCVQHRRRVGAMLAGNTTAAAPLPRR